MTSRRTQLGSALAILFAFAAIAAAGGQIYWQHDPGSPGDWFDPANWTAGVPSQLTYDEAYIDNGGTAQVSADEAESYRLYVGYTGAGRVVQTGGLVRPERFFLGHEVGSEGRYEMSGGSMLFDRAYIGRYGSGTFIHSGGRIGYTEGWMNLAWGLDSAGTYELSGTGEVYLRGITIGGAGVFRQLAGAVGVTGPLTVAATGSYELHGGVLGAGELLLRSSDGLGTGRLLQSGGITYAGYMEIGTYSRYELSGGQLRLTKMGGQIFGELDLANSRAELHLYEGILDCGRGTIRNAASAAFTGQANSLFVCPAGFDPQTDFGSFVTDGVVLQPGGSAVIPAGRTIRGQGVLPGHLEVHGTLEYSGGALAIIGGLAVADGGFVSLGGTNADLVVENEISGLGNGAILADEMCVGETGTGSFVQTAGDLFSLRLYLGAQAGSDGTYEMSGGTLYARTAKVGCGGRGHFRQTGGYAKGDYLMVGSGTGSEGLYELSGSAELFEDQERIGDRGTGVFVQTGGTNTVGRTYLHIAEEAGSDGTYEMRGGSLVTPYLDVGIDGTGRLIQSGGSITVENPLVVSSLSTYSVSGGTLNAEGLRVEGTLAVTAPGAHFQLSKFLSFGQTGRFTTAPGAAIHVVAAVFGHSSTDPGAMTGLSNLTLVIEGGDTGDDRYLCSLAATGADLGTDPLGWTDNFALGTLQLGGGDRRIVWLKDYHDNQQDGPDNEAVYVNWLVLNPGAKIEFNNLNLYFLNGGLPKQLFHGDANLDGCVDGLDYVVWANNYGSGPLLPGDANLDDVVDGLDYVTWSNHYLMGGVGLGEGDFNGDGVADGLDYIVWSNHYRAVAMRWSDGELTGDGAVDGLDYILWSNNYLQGCPGSPGPVPEPSSALLLLVGVWVVNRRRRCQKRR